MVCVVPHYEKGRSFVLSHYEKGRWFVLCLIMRKVGRLYCASL